MRGRTLSNAVVILDEAQNTTAMQMKMFLTRLGENSRMIVTGIRARSICRPATSGSEATRLLRNVEASATWSTPRRRIRHELVARIVDAYDKARRSRQPSAHNIAREIKE